MASNLSGLAKNIADSIAGLGNIFDKEFKGGPGSHPGDENNSNAAITKILNKVDSQNWNKQFPYTFDVVSGDEVGTSVGGFREFPLPINPSDIAQDETFAISIKPTQGGTVVNHSGNKYGDLVISGTTGIHPFRGTGGASSRTGKAIFQPDELKYRSGYEVFLRLRNWFKAYYQFKKIKQEGTGVEDARLVFKNFKDGEFLIVELIKFSGKRSASRKTLYDYTLNFRILGRMGFKEPEGPEGIFGVLADVDSVVNTAVDGIDTARGVFLRSQGILRQVESSYEATVIEPMRKAALAVKAFTGVGTVAADMSNKAIKANVSVPAALAILLGIKDAQDEARKGTGGDDRLTAVDLPANLEKAAETNGADAITEIGRNSDALMAIDPSEFPEEAIEALADEQSAALELPRSFFEDALADIKRVRDNAADAFNLGDAAFDAQFDRVATTKADPGKVVTDAEYELLAGFEGAIDGLNTLLSTNALFKSPYEQRIQNVKDNFGLGELDELQALPAVKEIIMPIETDLERLALKELGDATRWVEISELNDLKPPYVIQDQSDIRSNTVRPGEKLLIPQSIRDGFGNAPVVKENNLNKDLNSVERNLGIDVKLNADFDFALSNRGDFDIVRGVENAAQAVILKLSIERTELLEHPTIGMGLLPGSKGPITIGAFKTSLIETLTSDSRFEAVEKLEVRRVGPEIRLNFLLKVKNVDTPVPVDLKL